MNFSVVFCHFLQAQLPQKSTLYIYFLIAHSIRLYIIQRRRPTDILSWNVFTLSSIHWEHCTSAASKAVALWSKQSTVARLAIQLLVVVPCWCYFNCLLTFACTKSTSTNCRWSRNFYHTNISIIVIILALHIKFTRLKLSCHFHVQTHSIQLHAVVSNGHSDSEYLWHDSLRSLYQVWR